MSLLYIATNKVNGKQYIGQTRKGLQKRKQNHEKVSRNPASRSHGYFQRAIAKHGPKNFTWDVLTPDVPLEDLDELEELAIEINGTLKPNGYNIATGPRTVAGSTGGRAAGSMRRGSGQGLPAYISYLSRDGVVHGYQIDYNEQVKCIVSARYTMQQKLEIAVKWLEEMKRGAKMTRIYTRKHSEDDDLPPGISKNVDRKTGYITYYVRPMIDGRRVHKGFARGGPEQALKDAKAYLENLKTLQYKCGDE